MILLVAHQQSQGTIWFETTDGEGTTFFVRNYFKLTEMPFVALYKKDGDFVTSYTRDIALQELAQKLRQLQ